MTSFKNCVCCDRMTALSNVYTGVGRLRGDSYIQLSLPLVPEETLCLLKEGIQQLHLYQTLYVSKFSLILLWPPLHYLLIIIINSFLEAFDHSSRSCVAALVGVFFGQRGGKMSMYSCSRISLSTEENRRGHKDQYDSYS